MAYLDSLKSSLEEDKKNQEENDIRARKLLGISRPSDPELPETGFKDLASRIKGAYTEPAPDQPRNEQEETRYQLDKLAKTYPRVDIEANPDKFLSMAKEIAKNNIQARANKVVNDKASSIAESDKQKKLAEIYGQPVPESTSKYVPARENDESEVASPSSPPSTDPKIEAGAKAIADINSKIGKGKSSESPKIKETDLDELQKLVNDPRYAEKSGSLAEALKNARDAYDQKSTRLEWMEVGQELGRSLAQLGAASQGARSERDMSHLQFTPGIDFKSRREQLANEYNTESRTAAELASEQQKAREDEFRRKAALLTAGMSSKQHAAELASREKIAGMEVGGRKDIETLKIQLDAINKQQDARNKQAADKLAEAKGLEDDLTKMQTKGIDKQVIANRLHIPESKWYEFFKNDDDQIRAEGTKQVDALRAQAAELRRRAGNSADTAKESAAPNKGTITKEQLDAVSKRDGVPLEEARKKLTRAGYTVQ